MRLPLALPPATRPFDVLCVGENSIDIVARVDAPPESGSKHQLRGLAELPGGEAASTAVGLARLGWRVQYVGRFGDDRWGVLGRNSLAAEGVNVDDIVMTTGARSRAAVILVDGSGERTVLWDRDPAVRLVPGDIKADALSDCRVLLVGSDDVEAMHWAASQARAAGTRTVGDLEHVHSGTEVLLRELDIIIMAESFPAAFTGEANLEKALELIAAIRGTALLCVTLGSQGCVARLGSERIHVSAFPTRVVDTTGAGDLFRAGLIARWLLEPDGADVEQLLRYANAVAALNCRAVGARTAAPSRHEVDALLGP